MIRLNKTSIYTIVIILTIILTGIGYAFLSSQLSLNGAINVKKHEQQVDPEPEEQPICKRATTLHTETCSQTGTTGCKSSAETSSSITYGSKGTAGKLAAGDAFDCDVNGDGTYDSETERFYYVSDLETDSNYGAFIYYSSTKGGVASNNGTSSYRNLPSCDTNYDGPNLAKLELPTTSQWKNVNLSNTIRNIKDEQGTVKVSNYSYEGYAARLLTYQEVVSACGSTGISNRNYLTDKCIFLTEKTKFSNNSYVYGYWLETVLSSDFSKVGHLAGDTALITFNIYSISVATWDSTRPVIEVPKSKISY